MLTGLHCRHDRELRYELQRTAVYCSTNIYQSASVAVNYFISSSEEENSQIVLRSGTRFLTFQLSGQRATVVLRNDHHVDLYRIHLWVETNRVSLANGTHTLAESTVENPLTREDSGDFWLSWHDRALVVGHSQTVGEQVLVRTNLSEDIDVAAVSMYGGEGVPLDWMCSTDQGTGGRQLVATITIYYSRRDRNGSSIRICAEVDIES